MYHFSAQVISRKAGRSATAAAAYRAGEEVTDHRTGEVHDYTRKGGVVGASILAPADAPAWVFDREQLWNQVESAERRKDAQLCREIDAAIPVELDEHQRIEAVRQFVEAEMVSRGMVADVAFHDFDNDNPHCHIMLSMRDLEPDGFGKKNRDWNDRSVLNGWREKWAEHMNKALELAGEEKRIDHRSYADQGLDYEPTWHMGPAVAAMERRNPGSTAVGRMNQEIEARNEIIAQDYEAEALELDYLEAQTDDLEREIAVVEQEQLQEQLAEVRRLLNTPIGPETKPEPAPTPSPAPAPAAPPRQLTQWQETHKPKPNPSDRILSVMVSKTLDERPMPEPDGTVWEGRPLESWWRERWEKIKEVAEGLAQSARERLKPIFDRQVVQRAEAAGYRPESIESADLTPSQPQANTEPETAPEAPQNPPEQPGPDLDLDDLDDDEPTGSRLG